MTPVLSPSTNAKSTPPALWDGEAPDARAADDSLPRTARDFLRRCGDIYAEAATLASGAVGRVSTAVLLQRVETLANFAWHHHTGRYADATIENIAFDIGSSLNHTQLANKAEVPRPATEGTDRPVRRVLHVASTVYSVGGHTRLIDRWADFDKSRQHSLFLTRQGGASVPDWLAANIAERGGSIIFPAAGGSRADTALHLRAAARNGADCVVLHHHPNDCVPTVALAVNDLPPVALLNHADHVFWMGSSVADVVIGFRESGAVLARRRRFVRDDFVLPLPLSIPTDDALTRRDEFRSRLGVCAEEQMVLSVGTAYKYQPSAREDFFRAASTILDTVPTARLFLVGVSPEDYQRLRGRTEIERLHLVGPVDDTSLYNCAADLYLESVPVGSQTALLEAAAIGVPVVRSYANLSRMLASDDPAIDGLVSRPASEAEYVENAVRLLRDDSMRRTIGGALRRSVVNIHTGQGWLGRLEALYELLESQSHCAMRLMPARAEETADDIALAHLQRTDVTSVEWFVDHVLPSHSRGALVPTLRALRCMTSRRLIDPSTRRYLRVLQGWLRGALQRRSGA